jgi:hypothetical protein
LGNWRQLSDFCGSRWRVSLNSSRLSDSPIINHPSGNEQAGGRQQSGQKMQNANFIRANLRLTAKNQKSCSLVPIYVAETLIISILRTM